MDFRHVPVLYRECIENLNIKAGGIYVDGTLGGGGHAYGIGEKIGRDGILIGIDRDRDALEAAEQKLKPLPCRKILLAPEIVFGEDTGE